MSNSTAIQWCDSTVNPAMGCDGCELWTTIPKLAAAITECLLQENGAHSAVAKEEVIQVLDYENPSDAYHARKLIASEIAGWFPLPSDRDRDQLEEKIVRAIAAQFKCYAGFLHLRHGANEQKPEKHVNPGYAQKFEEVALYPGRTKVAAVWSDLRGQSRPDKPWLNGMPRLIFVSDMGDALSAGVSFEYLMQEIIEIVTSADGSRHLWLWLTKRPSRMAEFSEWMLARGINWPENLVAMTSVTSQKTAGRVAQLKKVRARFRGLSVEPLWGKVSLDFAGIDWVIVGGESALRPADAEPFDLAWARDLREQCHLAKTAFFVKQLGSWPVENGARLKLEDRHGGDWREWPKDLRIREMPPEFYSLYAEMTSSRA